MRPGILLWITSCIFLMKFIAFASGEDNGMLSTRHPCTLDMLKSNEKCVLDGFVGDKIDYEDDNVKIWSFNLEPGEMTSMHRHDHDYYFVVNNPSQLEVWGENGTRLFDFRAEGILGFRVQDDLLVPVNTEVKSALVSTLAFYLSPCDLSSILLCAATFRSSTHSFGQKYWRPDLS